MLSSTSHARIVYGLSHVYVLVISAVLLGAFWVQFFEQEYPCPLCILQRMAMMLAAMGAAFNLSVGIRVRHFGMSIIASIMGMLISTRQILLHIAPGDPGYGTPMFGMHLYSWAWVVFLSVIFACGIHLMASKDQAKEDIPPPPRSAFTWFVLALFGIIILANAIAVFFKLGWHWFLPDDPTGYRLLGDND